MTETEQPSPFPSATDLAARIDAAVVSGKRLWLAAKTHDPTLYRWGKRLRFDTAGNGGAHLGEGWHAPEKDRTWTAGGAANLLFCTGPALSRVRLRVLLTPFRPRGVKTQRIVVKVGAAQVAEWAAADTAWQQADIPPNLVSPRGVWSISLVPSSAGSPHETSGGNDYRALGVALHELTIETIDAFSNSRPPAT